MTAAAPLLALWLTPALWLALPDFILEDGPTGLWITLAVSLIPLIAVGVGRTATAEREAQWAAPFAASALVLVTGLLAWANLALAGDLAAGLGAPRWQGIAVAAGAAWLFTTWRGAGRIIPALLLAGALLLAVPSADLVREAGVDPLRAWDRVAAEAAFRFPARSAWVTSGQDMGRARGRTDLVFDEEHRVTAPSGGVLRSRSSDGGGVSEREWSLAPGQSVTFRAGDRLLEPLALPLRFEAGKRVPGAPPSGAAWAAGGPIDWGRAADLHVTLVMGGVALLCTGATRSFPRRAVLMLGAALLAVSLWAQGWAIYGALGAPDVFLGGVTVGRLAEMRAAPPARQALGGLVLASAIMSFAASMIALRDRVTALDARASGHVTRRPLAWVALFGAAALAGLYGADPWSILMLAFGTAAASLGPATLWPPERSGAATAAGAVGLALFVVLAALGALQSVAPEAVRVSRPASVAALWTAALDHPVLAALVAGAAVLWAFGRPARPRRRQVRGAA